MVNYLRKKVNTLEDAKEDYELSVDSHLGVSELPDSDEDLENVHPDILQKMDCLSPNQLVAVAVKALTRLHEEYVFEILTARVKSCNYNLNQLIRKLPSYNREKLLDEMFPTVAVA